MSNQNSAHTRSINGWVVRERKPVQVEPNAPVILLLHGWTGDENSMWIFASRLPESGYLIAPRGIYHAPSGGYGWETRINPGRARLEDFRLAVEQLSGLLTVKNFPDADLSRLHLMGFSQGAALAFSYALFQPVGVQSILSLSGFMPTGAENYLNQDALRGIPVFLAHGTRDELVPIQNAWVAAAVLERAGANVSTCEDEVGHKLSASCFKGLEAFLAQYFD